MATIEELINNKIISRNLISPSIVLTTFQNILDHIRETLFYGKDPSGDILVICNNIYKAWENLPADNKLLSEGLVSKAILSNADYFRSITVYNQYGPGREEISKKVLSTLTQLYLSFKKGGFDAAKVDLNDKYIHNMFT